MLYLAKYQNRVLKHMKQSKITNHTHEKKEFYFKELDHNFGL